VPKVKMKTNKAAKSRFKVTATGKLMRHRQGARHLLIKKSSRKKHALKKATTVSTAHLKLYKHMMGVA
jgi:large subunit ribosomal protein L35